MSSILFRMKSTPERMGLIVNPSNKIKSQFSFIKLNVIGVFKHVVANNIADNIKSEFKEDLDLYYEKKEKGGLIEAKISGSAVLPDHSESMKLKSKMELYLNGYSNPKIVRERALNGPI